MRNFTQNQINYLNGVEIVVGDKFKVYIQNQSPEDVGHDPLYIKYTYANSKSSLVDITDDILSLHVVGEYDPDSPYGPDIPLASISRCTIALDDTEILDTISGIFQSTTVPKYKSISEDFFIPQKFGIVIEYNDGVDPAVAYFTGLLVRDVNRNDKEQLYVLDFQDYSLLFKSVQTQNYAYIGNLEGSPEVKARVGQDPIPPTQDPDDVVPDTKGQAGISTDNGANWTLIDAFKEGGALNGASLSPSTVWSDIGWGNGEWRACGSNGWVAHSADGINWFAGRFGGGEDWTRFRFLGSKWLLGGPNGLVLFSDNSSSPVSVIVVPGGPGIIDMAYVTGSSGGPHWVVATTDGKCYQMPTTGSSWTAIFGTIFATAIENTNTGLLGVTATGDTFFAPNANLAFGVDMPNFSPGNSLSAIAQNGNEVLIAAGNTTSVYVDSNIDQNSDFSGSGVTGLGNGLARVIRGGGLYVGIEAGDSGIVTSATGGAWVIKDNFTGGSLKGIANLASSFIVISASDMTEDGTGSSTPGDFDPGKPAVLPVEAEPAILADCDNTYYYLDQEKPALMGYIQERFIYEQARQYRISAECSDVTDVRAMAIIAGSRTTPKDEYFLPENTHFSFRLDTLNPLTKTIAGASGKMILGLTNTKPIPFKVRWFVQTKLKAVEYARHIFRVVFAKTVNISGRQVKITDNFWDKGSHASFITAFENEFTKLLVGEGAEQGHQDDKMFEGVIDNNQGNMWRALQEKICASTKFIIHFDGSGNFKIKKRQFVAGVYDSNANAIQIKQNKNLMFEFTKDFSYKYYNRTQTKSKKYQVVKGNFNEDQNGHISRVEPAQSDPNQVHLGQVIGTYSRLGVVTLSLETYGLQWIDQHRFLGDNLGSGDLTDSNFDGSSHDAPEGYGEKNAIIKDKTARPIYTQVSKLDGSGGLTDFLSYNVFDYTTNAKSITLFFKLDPTTLASYVIPNGLTVSVGGGVPLVEGLVTLTDGDSVFLIVYGYPLRKFPTYVTVSNEDKTITNPYTSIDGTFASDLQLKNGFSLITIQTPHSIPRVIVGSEVVFDWIDFYLIKYFGNKKKRFNTEEMIMPFFEVGDTTQMIDENGNLVPIHIEKEELIISESQIATKHKQVEWK